MTWLLLVAAFVGVAYVFPNFPLWGGVLVGLVLATITRTGEAILRRKDDD